MTCRHFQLQLNAVEHETKTLVFKQHTNTHLQVHVVVQVHESLVQLLGQTGGDFCADRRHTRFQGFFKACDKREKSKSDTLMPMCSRW